MKSLIAIAAAFMLAVFFVSAQAQETTQPQQYGQGQAEMKSGQAMTDGEILAFIIAVNEHEIAAANAAIQKNPGAQVMEYAKKLNEDHSANLEKAQGLDVKPQETAAVERFKQTHEADLQKMNQLSGGAFGNAYINEMVKGHSKVLDMIDKQFLPAVKDQGLKDHLNATRASVANHLAEAKQLKSGLSSN